MGHDLSRAEPIIRHPSQLYEAIFEGIALFFILLFCLNIFINKVDYLGYF